MKWVTENHIPLDASLYAKLMNTIEGSRAEFTMQQKILIDVDREHKTLKATFPNSLIIGSLMMFLSYLIGGFVPILPIFFTLPPTSSVLSVIFAFTGLFALGFFKAKLFSGQVWRSAIEMLLIGGLTTLIGLFVGFTLKI
jgi:VIT1/CCC1 family predicted Fe2+/Mn2+ transporter